MTVMRKDIQIFPGKYEEMVRRNIFLPEALVHDLKFIATQQRISYSELVRQILVKHVEKLQRSRA